MNPLGPASAPHLPAGLRRRLALPLLRAENGDAIIEMAVIMPAFTLLLLGIFQFSMALTGYLSAEYAINIATRYAALHSSTSLAPCSSTDVQNLIQSSLFTPSAAPTSISVAYYQYASAGGNVVGNVIYVSAIFSQTISVPFYNRTFSIRSNDYRVISR